MRWSHAVAYFFGGLFLANFVPHFVSGITGHPFQSPFAHPPGEGLSSAPINVLWGFSNLIVAYVLLTRFGAIEPRRWQHALAVGLGVLAMALMLSTTFGRFYGGLTDGPPPHVGLAPQGAPESMGARLGSSLNIQRDGLVGS